MSQHAPRLATILLAAVLVAVGMAGTFLGLIPGVAGVSGATIGIAAYAAATVVMLAGVFIRGI